MNTTANKQRASFHKLFDSEFRAKLKSAPVNAVTELGYTNTAGVEFVVKENTPKVTYCAVARAGWDFPGIAVTERQITALPPENKTERYADGDHTVSVPVAVTAPAR